MTVNQQLYKKEIARIKKFIRRAEARGYRFDYEIPKMPKRVTSSYLKELKKKTTPEMLYRKATAIGDSGKIVSGTERRKEERKEAALKGIQKKKMVLPAPVSKPSAGAIPKFSDIVLSNIRALIAKYPTKGAELLEELLRYEINTYGEDKVAEACEEHTELIELAETIVYYSSSKERLHAALTAFAEIIQGTILEDDVRSKIDEAIAEDIGWEDL